MQLPKEETPTNQDPKAKKKVVSVRSNPPEVFLGKSILKLCIKFTGEHPCRSVI